MKKVKHEDEVVREGSTIEEEVDVVMVGTVEDVEVAVDTSLDSTCRFYASI